MALLKFFLGNSSDLENIPPIDGYLYFCTDDSNFYIDCYDPAQGAVVRKVVGGDQGEVDIDTSNLVTLNTAQTITGAKTFNKTVNVSAFPKVGDDLSGKTIYFNTNINQTNWMNYYTANEDFLVSSGGYTLKSGGPPDIYLAKNNSSSQLFFSYMNNTWGGVTSCTLHDDFGTVTSISDNLKNIIVPTLSLASLNFIFPQNYDYTPAATESIATREWVENYIANNMPTYPAAEGASF